MPTSSLFLDSLQVAGVPMYRTTLGTTTEGRVLPLVVLSRPVVRTPAEAKALHRPIVYVEANIHSNEIEGKEALQALIRDLATSTERERARFDRPDRGADLQRRREREDGGRRR